MWLRGRGAAQLHGTPHSTSLVLPKGPEEGKSPGLWGSWGRQGSRSRGPAVGARARREGRGCCGSRLPRKGAHRACCDRVTEGLTHRKAGGGHHHSHTKQRPTMYEQITARFPVFTAASRSLHGCSAPRPGCLLLSAPYRVKALKAQSL